MIKHIILVLSIGKEVDTHQPVHTGSFIGMKVVQKGVHQVLHCLTVTKELLEYYQEDQVHVDQVEVIYMGNYPRHFKLLI